MIEKWILFTEIRWRLSMSPTSVWWKNYIRAWSNNVGGKHCLHGRRRPYSTTAPVSGELSRTRSNFTLCLACFQHCRLIMSQQNVNGSIVHWPAQAKRRLAPSFSITRFFISFYYSPRATRSIHENNVYIEDRRPTDQRPTDLVFCKISNGHISLRVWFDGRVFGSADRTSLLPAGPNPRSLSLAVLYNRPNWMAISLKRFIRSNLVLG